MKSTIRISLKPGEKIFINGAVLRADRKTSLELLNDVSFLLEDYVMQTEEVNTPLQQLYFFLQMMLIEPESRDQTNKLYLDLFRLLVTSSRLFEIQHGLARADLEVRRGRIFEAMKIIRGLFDLAEDEHIGELEVMAAC